MARPSTRRIIDRKSPLTDATNRRNTQALAPTDDRKGTRMRTAHLGEIELQMLCLQGLDRLIVDELLLYSDGGYALAKLGCGRRCCCTALRYYSCHALRRRA